MRHLVCVSALCAIFAAQSLPAATWLTDFGAAKQRVAAENKPVLMLFTGSDWCPACQNLKRDVFARPEFAAYADANLILLELDFPRNRPLPGAQKQANRSLADAYKVRYYPTMILLDMRGEEVVRPRYDGNGVKDFLATLDNYVHNTVATAQGGGKARGGSARPVHATAPEPVPLFNGAATAPPPRYTDLVLKNISGNPNRRFALINNQTFAAGEAARVKLADGEVQVRCLEIRPQSVVVTVAGQTGQRELKLADAR
jgi:thioredoxin-related protein